ncbi:MAG: dihydrofolate reductase family protein [Candidatus Merdisoma sp.]|jgi:dihydrofolate reductase
MRKVTLFIAVSLDGYIADRNGDVNWLNGQEENGDNFGSYSEFISGIDTVIMGWNTYHQVVTELSPDEWVYPEQKSYVITHREIPSTEAIVFTAENPCALVRSLRKEEGEGIWICGGADIIQQLMKEDLIDRWHISVIPTLLGSGIRLFGELAAERKLQLVKTQSYNGITNLIYERRK